MKEIIGNQILLKKNKSDPHSSNFFRLLAIGKVLGQNSVQCDDYLNPLSYLTQHHQPL